MAVALALGIGTMIGWRRVATTIGEKIGKKGMTYAGDVGSDDRRSLYRPRQLHPVCPFPPPTFSLFRCGDDGC